MSIHSKSLFTRAQQLEPGDSITAEFSSKRKAESVRVSLYRERKYYGDPSISISSEGNKVILEKEKENFMVTIRSADGTTKEEKLSKLRSSRNGTDENYNLELQEIHEMAEEANYRQELIDELVNNLNERYGRS
jgi:hypothetical protein